MRRFATILICLLAAPTTASAADDGCAAATEVVRSISAAAAAYMVDDVATIRTSAAALADAVEKSAPLAEAEGWPVEYTALLVDVGPMAAGIRDREGELMEGEGDALISYADQLKTETIKRCGEDAIPAEANASTKG